MITLNRAFLYMATGGELSNKIRALWTSDSIHNPWVFVFAVFPTDFTVNCRLSRAFKASCLVSSNICIHMHHNSCSVNSLVNHVSYLIPTQLFHDGEAIEICTFWYIKPVMSAVTWATWHENIHKIIDSWQCDQYFCYTVI